MYEDQVTATKKGADDTEGEIELKLNLQAEQPKVVEDKDKKLTNISQKILVSDDLKVIDGHHNWAGLSIAYQIAFSEPSKPAKSSNTTQPSEPAKTSNLSEVKVKVKKVKLDFIDYYHYAMQHPLIFSIDYQDNYIPRLRVQMKREYLNGGARRKYKKKSRQRGGKRSRKSSFSNNRKARKTNKRRKRKITLKNMSPKLLEAFSTLNRIYRPPPYHSCHVRTFDIWLDEN